MGEMAWALGGSCHILTDAYAEHRKVKEAKTWVIREKETKAEENNRRRPSSAQRKSER